MRGNAAVAALSILQSRTQSPLFASSNILGHQSIGLSRLTLARFQSPVLVSKSPIDVSSSLSSFRNFIDICFDISSVSGSNFSSYLAYTSNATVTFTNCYFADITSSNYAGALFVDYSACVTTVTSCNFQRIYCTHSQECSSGAFTVHSSTVVSMVSNYFSQCSANDPDSFLIAVQFNSAIMNTDINETTETNVGNYGGVAGYYASMSGGVKRICLRGNNHTTVRASLHASGHSIVQPPRGGSFISFLLISNCSGTAIFSVIYATTATVVGQSIFRYNSATTGIVEFFQCVSTLIFSECAFIALPAVPMAFAYSSGFGVLTFDRCCFDNPISVTYESIEAFLSTVSGQCLALNSNKFTIRCPYSISPSYIFPILMSSFILSM